ncbi:hypothetical protein L9F63_012269, partial [Diploptera punctata]
MLTFYFCACAYACFSVPIRLRVAFLLASARLSGFVLLASVRLFGFVLLLASVRLSGFVLLLASVHLSGLRLYACFSSPLACPASGCLPVSTPLSGFSSLDRLRVACSLQIACPGVWIACLLEARLPGVGLPERLSSCPGFSSPTWLVVPIAGLAYRALAYSRFAYSASATCLIQFASPASACFLLQFAYPASAFCSHQFAYRASASCLLACFSSPVRHRLLLDSARLRVFGYLPASAHLPDLDFLLISAPLPGFRFIAFFGAVIRFPGFLRVPCFLQMACSVSSSML